MSKSLSALKISAVKSSGEIPSVVAFHRRMFDRNFTGPFGKMFLELYFRRIAESPYGVIYIAQDGEKIVGLIIGLASKKKIQDMSLFFAGALVTVWQLLVRPKIFVLILRHIKRMLTAPRDEKCDAELESIAVDPDYRRMGVGQRLIESMESFFVSQKVSEYELVTDLVEGEGYKFYARLGFSILRHVSLFGLKSRVYRKKLS